MAENLQPEREKKFDAFVAKNEALVGVTALFVALVLGVLVGLFIGKRLK